MTRSSESRSWAERASR